MPLNNFGLCGPRIGRCAQPDKDGFKIIEQLGFGTILKLNTDDEFPYVVERSLYSGTIMNMPIDSFDPDETVVQRLVDEIQQLSGKLLIHCEHGRDRTGFVCAAYRILVDKWTSDDAWEEMKQYGWTVFSSLTDSAIHDVLNKLGGK